MNRRLLYAALIVVALAACKEVGPPVNFYNTYINDSTYMVAAPATQAHNVLVEDFSGQSCPNCPGAHASVAAISASDSGRVIVLTYYGHLGPQSDTVSGYPLDLRSSTVDAISNDIYGGVNALPSGSVDRVAQAGVLDLYSSSWPSVISTRLTDNDSLNVYLRSSYDASINMDTITVTVVYTQNVSSAQFINIAVAEDSILGVQEFYTGDSSYVFDDVFRKMVTAVPSGDLVLPRGTYSKIPGRAYQRTYTCQLQPGWAAKHCKVVAFVTDATYQNVYQSAQINLTTH
jgi:Outer membrane protein Omp28